MEIKLADMWSCAGLSVTAAATKEKDANIIQEAKAVDRQTHTCGLKSFSPKLLVP